MAEDSFALSIIASPSPGQDDYDVIYATVMESARGRRFLEEYARRNRNTDTDRLLAAIERIENLFRYLEQRIGRTPTAAQMPRAAASDPLAALKAMTDEERIALFT